MATSLRFQIQKGFSRLVTKYAILSGSILLLLVAAFVLYTTRSNLVSQSDIVRTQLCNDPPKVAQVMLLTGSY